MTSVAVRRGELDSPVAAALIAALNAELTEMYPEPGATHFGLAAHDVASGRGAFVVAWLDDRPVGCGAIRPNEDAFEVKRMFVRAEARGLGVSRVILRALEDEARALGAKRLVLETGIRQIAAIALYESEGFARIPPFGEYVASAATSVCMAKELV